MILNLSTCTLMKTGVLLLFFLFPSASLIFDAAAHSCSHITNPELAIPLIKGKDSAVRYSLNNSMVDTEFLCEI